jgi:CRISPR-associated protein Csh2
MSKKQNKETVDIHNEYEKHDNISRKFIHIFEAINCNPNGDPDSDNRPRFDYDTDRCEISHFRCKRIFRDYRKSYKDDIFYYYDFNNITKLKNDYKIKDTDGASMRIATERKEQIKYENVSERDFLLDYIDNRLFGMVGDGHHIEGCIQQEGVLTKSLNKCEIKTVKNTSIFPSNSKNKQGTFGVVQIIPYAIFSNVYNYNGRTGEKNKVRKNDIDTFIIDTYKGFDKIKTSSKNFNSICMIEIIGDDTNPSIKNLDKSIIIDKIDNITSLDDFKFNFEKISELSEEDYITKINIYTDKNYVDIFEELKGNKIELKTII